MTRKKEALSAKAEPTIDEGAMAQKRVAQGARDPFSPSAATKTRPTPEALRTLKKRIPLVGSRRIRSDVKL
jgi:hypothetical protein